jgi:hypothetical protein
MAEPHAIVVIDTKEAEAKLREFKESVKNLERRIEMLSVPSENARKFGASLIATIIVLTFAIALSAVVLALAYRLVVWIVGL